MAMINQSSKTTAAGQSDGFGLLEFLIAMAILLIGLTGVMALFAHAIVSLSYSEQNVIAKQKARETMESIFTARNTAQVTFDQINNVSNSGVFLNGLQPLKVPGTDGVVGTSDDGGVETMVLAGPDGIVGTSDDKTITLNTFQREIAITSLNNDLRQVAVTIKYHTAQGAAKKYQVVSYISRFR